MNIESIISIDRERKVEPNLLFFQFNFGAKSEKTKIERRPFSFELPLEWEWDRVRRKSSESLQFT